MVQLFDLYYLDRVERPIPGLEMKCPCEGYAGLNLPREEMSPIMLDLRSRRIRAYAVPTAYRDMPPSSEDLFLRAQETLRKRWGTRIKSVIECGGTPMWRIFKALLDEGGQGFLSLDRIDGHVWDDATEEYFLGWTENPEFELAARDAVQASTFDEKLAALERIVKSAHPSGKMLLEIELRWAKNESDRSAIQALIDR